METLVLVIATVQEYPIRDTRNRSKRKSQQRHDTGEEREKKRTSSYLLRQCFQSRNLDTFFFATGFTVQVPLSIFRGIFSSSAAHRELPNNPPRERPLQEYLSHDDIDYSRFPKSIRNFKFPARPRDRRPFNRGGRDRRKTSQLQSTVHGFPRPFISFHRFFPPFPFEMES